MQNRIIPFLNVADTAARLYLIKNNLTKFSMEVSFEGEKLTVKRKREITIGGVGDEGLEFMQACLDKEFEVASSVLAQSLLPTIANYVNGRPENIDIISAYIDLSEPKPFAAVGNRELTNTEVIAGLVFKNGLVPMQEAVDFKVENLALSNNIVEECPLPSDWQGKYNPNTMLEYVQVSAMTYHLLKSENLEPSKHYYLYQVNLADELEALRKEEQIKLALLSATQGKPVALQLANDNHWITICLLPDKIDKGKINLVMMDGRAEDKVGKLEVDYLSEKEKAMILATSDQHHLDPQEVVKKLKALGPKLGMNVSELHDMSVKGQQHNNSCGLDTTLNTAAIIKTHEGYTVEFNPETFKTALDQNVYYQKKFKTALDQNVYYQKKYDMYYICGQESYLQQGSIVEKIGNDLLLRSVDQKENINRPEGTIQDFLKGKELVIQQIVGQGFDPSNRNKDDNSSSEKRAIQKLEVVSNDQKSQFYQELNTFLNNDTNKKLLAKYIREKDINFEENNSQLERVDQNLTDNVKAVMEMAKPGEDISLGLINGFIVWFANLVGWEKSDLFKIVNENTAAKSWAEKIKPEIPKDQTSIQGPL